MTVGIYASSWQGLAEQGEHWLCSGDPFLPLISSVTGQGSHFSAQATGLKVKKELEEYARG